MNVVTRPKRAIFKPLLICLVAVGASACAPTLLTNASPTTNPVAIETVALTTDPPPGVGTIPPCPGSFVEGLLTETDEWGIAIQPMGGKITRVIWPYGYFARRLIGGLALVNESGATLARTGQRVRIGGGEFNGAWRGCGTIELI